MTEPLDDDYLLEHAREQQRRAANHHTAGGDRCTRCPHAPFAYFGGKTRLLAGPDRRPAAARLHDHYVEPFAGSLAVLLAKPRSPMETVNDLDGDLMTFWRVLRERPDDLAGQWRSPRTPAPSTRPPTTSTSMTIWNGPAACGCAVAGPREHDAPHRVAVLREAPRRHVWGCPATSPPTSTACRQLRERLAGVSLECRALDLIGATGSTRTCSLLRPAVPRQHPGSATTTHEMTHRRRAPGTRGRAQRLQGRRRPVRLPLAAVRRPLRRLAPRRTQGVDRQRHPQRRHQDRRRPHRGPVVQPAVPRLLVLLLMPRTSDCSR
jgi:hypothetical protein